MKWADLILVMEQKHKKKLFDQFHDQLQNKTVIVLDIPDNYRFMDKELIKELKLCVLPILDSYISP